MGFLFNFFFTPTKNMISDDAFIKGNVEELRKTLKEEMKGDRAPVKH